MFFVNNVIGGGSASITQITYTELVELKNNAQLKSGQLYRITDYVATTTTFLTQSANHAFDVIVLALDNSTLSEEAAAIQHEGDTYFANSNLNAWQIWYSLENDTTRFAWADAVNGKGVIYRMVDEFNNDCPYDFKGIQYQKRMGFIYTQWGNNYTFYRNETLDVVIADVQYYGYSCNITPTAWSDNNCLITDTRPTTNSILYKLDGAQISYGGNIIDVFTENYDCYTFGVDNDNSLDGNDYSNIIPAYYKDNKQNLNFITFGNDCYSNSFGNDCYSNSFGNDCHSNSFGNDCYSNSFGNYCYSNSFGNYCYSNSFDNNCYSNSFGNSCCYNSFGYNCYYNSFGNHCISNSFGNECSTNSFGNDCYTNSFGNFCYSNSFGNKFTSNSFGNECYYNSFGNYCSSNSFSNFCISNSFGNSCVCIKLITTETETSGKYQYYKFASGLQGSSGDNMLEITLTPNLEYETYVAKDSNGNLKQGCLADLLS